MTTETLERHEIVTSVAAPEGQEMVDENIHLSIAPQNFYDRVERVADCLVKAAAAGYFKLDTKSNPVHAYVDACYH